MTDVAPNLSVLIGEIIGARLISHAGSLTNLAKYPGSTVQILGAEKALFRALKTRGNTPKYGLLFNSTYISRASSADKGRISRYLANKCSIASRMDAFSDFSTNKIGLALKQQVEDRLSFYESGKPVRPNLEVMKEALQSALQAEDEEANKSKKKRKSSADDDHSSSKKKKKSKKESPEKKKKSEDSEDLASEEEKKKKQKKEQGRRTSRRKEEK